MSNRWLVAGTAGGVGTTTVTALLFGACRERLTAAPQLFDHTAGSLGERLPDSDDVRAVDPRLALHDFGPHAGGAAIDELADPTTTVLLVGAATPVGVDQLVATLGSIGEAHRVDGLRRTVVVAVETFGRYGGNRLSGRIRAVQGVRGVEVLRQDPTLGAGGRIPWTRLSRRSRATVDRVVDLLLAPTT